MTLDEKMDKLEKTVELLTTVVLRICETNILGDQNYNPKDGERGFYNIMNGYFKESKDMIEELKNQQKPNIPLKDC